MNGRRSSVVRDARSGYICTDHRCVGGEDKVAVVEPGLRREKEKDERNKSLCWRFQGLSAESD